MTTIDETLEPLEAEIASLVAAVREPAPLANDVQARIYSAFQTKLAALPASGDMPNHSNVSASGAAVSVARATPTALASVKGLAVVAAVFSAGISVGVGVDRAVNSPAETTRVVTIVATSSATVARQEIPPVEVSSLPRAMPSAKPAMSASAPNLSAEGLAGERALLDVARTALAHGRPDEALAATVRHAATYPSGALSEERDSMTIRALVAKGDMDQARRKADVFAKRYPGGLMLPGILALVDAGL